jgi:hypothetical protein
MRNTLLASVLVLIGCDQISSNAPPLATPAPAKSDPRIDAMQKDIADMKARLATDRSSINGMFAQILALQPNVSGEFSTGDNGYQSLETNFGRMLVAVESLEPYADGTKVTLSIGNIYSIRFSGMKLSVSWNKRQPTVDDPAYGEKYNAWYPETKSKDFDVPDEILPGAWNKVTITLPGSPPAQVGYLAISMKLNMVRMPMRK